MDTIDLLFPVIGSQLPTDHGYALYSAVSHQLACLHDGRVSFGFAPVTGLHVGDGFLQLDPLHSQLRLRLAAADIPHVLPLAGKQLGLMGHRIRLGPPVIESLRPVPSLIARMVAIKHAMTSDSFLDAARRQLRDRGINGNPRVPDHFDKAGRKEPMRRVVRIKDVRVVGYSLLVEELKPEDSLKLQELGLGGRRHIGCGLFVPARENK